MEGKKILFISTKIHPIVGGDTIYSAGVIYRLAKRNKVTLITLGNEDKLKKNKIFKEVKVICFSGLKGNWYKFSKLIFNQSLLQDHSFRIKSFLEQENLKKYDYIILDHLRSYSVSKPIFKKNDQKPKIIYIAHNVESINQKEKLDLLPNKRVLSLLSNNVHKIEKKMLSKCDTVWTLNQKDLEKLTRNHHKKNTVVKPFFPWPRVKKDKDIQNASNELLILGSLNWYPNIEGVLHFVKEIFPLITKKKSLIKLNIVGQNPSKEILSLANSKIRIYPNVKSVDPYIKRAELLIIPNKSGTGSKIKLLEAIMKGLPLVTYSENIVGYNNLKIQKPFLAENSIDFANCVLELLENKKLKQDFINKNILLIEKNNNEI